MLWQCGSHELGLQGPKVMGILNVTPDSFSDGGKYNNIDKALVHAVKMVKEGACIIDVGGESTRPGSFPISLNEELDRTIPVIEKLKQSLNTIISIDTTKPIVMEEAIKAGANIINSINALETSGAIEVAAKYKAGVCLMHRRGTPSIMQHDPVYHDVINEISAYLVHRSQVCIHAGIDVKAICIDPGFGFGKTLQHNLIMLKNLHKFVELGFPILVGVSRKAMLKEILGVNVENRLYGSIALHSIAAMHGAHIIRAHDVEATVQALTIVERLHSI